MIQTDYTKLSQQIKEWGRELGFQSVGISDTDLSVYEKRYNEIIAKGYHGEMDYMTKHGEKRTKPALLVPGTLRIISVRMNYLPQEPRFIKALANPFKAYLSRYALGRDYHKVLRKRLLLLSQKIEEYIPNSQFRVFCDSAPVLEKPIAEKAGLGWIGKHTNLINRKAGSWFFLGEIFTDIPLPIDTPETSHCGSCQACLSICPTQAIVAPYQLDARRCIAYLTIELKSTIPIDLRPLIGNRIYGCDDCQLICPWNKFASFSAEKDFRIRHGLEMVDLVSLFRWDEADFLHYTEGSAIRRIGHAQWLRNIAVGLGNAPYHPDVVDALNARLSYPNEMVQEHILWALDEQRRKKARQEP